MLIVVDWETTGYNALEPRHKIILGHFRKVEETFEKLFRRPNDLKKRAVRELRKPLRWTYSPAALVYEGPK